RIQTLGGADGHHSTAAAGVQNFFVATQYELIQQPFPQLEFAFPAGSNLAEGHARAGSRRQSQHCKKSRGRSGILLMIDVPDGESDSQGPSCAVPPMLDEL